MAKVIDEVTNEQLIADFKKMVADAEALLKATASHGGDEMAELRAKVEESIKAAKTRLVDEQAALMARTKEAAKATDVYVHDHPWMAIGVAAGFGLVVGLLSNRH
ncbi:DUF883 family protein [Sedimenticola hydrogenitrophicus]|uniref:DUF883 family protein n=1 Tax=Sedimenticola hydrogenitrophicus TaxID=2967975 RepID=UPI0021A3FB37|nr:DUF883 family protein [Sedimenticola hydrogenitrophicus]